MAGSPDYAKSARLLHGFEKMLVKLKAETGRLIFFTNERFDDSEDDSEDDVSADETALLRQWDLMLSGTYVFTFPASFARSATVTALPARSELNDFVVSYELAIDGKVVVDQSLVVTTYDGFVGTKTPLTQGMRRTRISSG